MQAVKENMKDNNRQNIILFFYYFILFITCSMFNNIIQIMLQFQCDPHFFRAVKTHLPAIFSVCFPYAVFYSRVYSSSTPLPAAPSRCCFNLHFQLEVFGQIVRTFDLQIYTYVSPFFPSAPFALCGLTARSHITGTAPPPPTAAATFHPAALWAHQH